MVSALLMDASKQCESPSYSHVTVDKNEQSLSPVRLKICLRFAQPAEAMNIKYSDVSK